MAKYSELVRLDEFSKTKSANSCINLIKYEKQLIKVDKTFLFKKFSCFCV